MPIHLHQSGSKPAEVRLRLGLVNNMPEAAWNATEKQILSLVARASAGTLVSVSLFALPGIAPPAHAGRYLSLDRLMSSELDGLIVTGREPLTSNLRAESYWSSFCVLLEWARKHTVSTLWSCLAAHAAVLHLDGIVRERRKEKYSGVFASTPSAPHALTVGMPVDARVPHSRWNGLPQEQLASKGYQVLTCAGQGEVDLFIKEQESLFVFAQGHLEYDTDTLLREYRRDLGRFLRDEAGIFPPAPTCYFDQATEAALALLRERAGSEPKEAVLAESLTLLEQAAIENTWAQSGEGLYRDWLMLLAARSQVRLPAPLLTSTRNQPAG